MMLKKNSHMFTLGAFLTLLTLSHVLIFQKRSPRVVLEELYFVPILFGALRSGL